MAFVLASGLLIAAALALILSSGRANRVVSRTVAGANLAVYRRQLADLERDRRDGLITDQEFGQDREEIEVRLLTDLAVGAGTKHAEGPASDLGVVGPVLMIGLPLAAVLLYLSFGAPVMSR